MKNHIIKSLTFIIVFACSASIYAQTYHLVWEEKFDGFSLDSSIWNVEERIGIWNTAQNAELQFYQTDNVTVGDDGNGNNCLIITAESETYKGYSFTSGRVDTNTKFSFKFGRLDARIRIPDLKDGLWPAFWTEGFTSVGWPAMGEIDILEMGHKEGIALDSVNSFVASATHWEYNNTRADYSASRLAAVDLSDGYHLVSMEWTPTYIKTYLDSTTLIFNFALTGLDLEEYKDYFNFILINLAVGGILPDIKTPGEITAPFPAKMYVDYIKLYQIEGQENFTVGPHPVEGDFGVFSENNLFASLNPKFDAVVNSQGLDSDLTAPFEGVQILSYKTQAATGFNVGVKALTLRNMSGYQNGSVSFMIKTNYTANLELSISDTQGQSASLVLDADKFYNPDRDNTWQQVIIPMSEFTGTIDFSKMETLFKISGTGNASVNQISVDNIIWKEDYSGGPITDQYYGLFAEHPAITKRLDFAGSGHLYVWNGFTAAKVTPFYGKDVIAFNANASTWNGFGLQSDDPINLSAFSNGYMNFIIKTASTQEFVFGFKNLADQGWEIKYAAGATTSQFKRDNKWHLVSIPLKNFLPLNGAPAVSANTLEDITIPFYLVGTINFSLDEVFYSRDALRPDYGINFTGISNESAERLKVFPVPSGDFITISGLDSEARIEIFTIDGKIIERFITDSDLLVDVADYRPGIYLVSIHTKKGNLNKRFIVE